MSKRKTSGKKLLYVLAVIILLGTSIGVFHDDGRDEEYVKYTFRTNANLQEHFEKHGIDMGFSTAEEYQDRASDVVNSTKALFKLEKEDGDGVFYIEETNEFAILSTDGFIRTYFLPDAGKAYFDKQ